MAQIKFNARHGVSVGTTPVDVIDASGNATFVTVGGTWQGNVIGSAYGGTGNAFMQFSGPASTTKTFTLPNSNATLLYSGGALGTPSSGVLANCTFPTLNQNTTGTAAAIAGGTQWGFLYQQASGSTTTTTPGAAGQVLKSNATSAPTWVNGTITLGSTAISLGTSTSTLDGLSSVTSTSFVGALTGNASTASSSAILTTGRTIGMTGDVSWTSAAFNGSGNVTGTSTIGNNAVTLAKMATVATNTILGRVTAATGNVETLTAAQAKTVLAIAQADVAGLKTTDSPSFVGITLSGNLTVNGTTTTVNSTTVTLDDPILTLGGNTAPTVDDNKDRGIEFRWHNGSAAKVGFFGFDDSTGYLTFIPDATNASEVFSGTMGDIQATNFRGALIGNASTATSVAGQTQWGFLYQSSAGVTASTAAGTSGQVLKSNATSAPTWVNGTISGVALGSNLASLTLNVSGTGLSGSASYNGSGAATFTVTSNATNANTVSTIVARDASGNFSAGTITAALTGNASTATTLATGRTIGMTGDVSWTSAAFNGSGNVTGTSTIGANKVTLAKMATMATASFLGRNTAATGNVEVLSAATAKSMLSIGNGTLGAAAGSTGATNTTITLNFSGAYSADTTSNVTVNPVIGPALTNLASYMTGVGNIGFIKKTAADTYTVDTNTYLTGNQTITLSGHITGSGTTSISTSLGSFTLAQLNTAINDADVASSTHNHSGTYEPVISAGTTAQYWRGDKSWQTLNATSVGLGNVTNESKATMFVGPTFTGVPVAPTASVGTNTTQLATTAFVLANRTQPTSIVNKTTAYTLTTSDNVITADATSASFTLTLPAVSGNSGLTYTIKKIDSSVNTITIDANASKTIDGSLTQVITVQYQSITIICNGTAWYII